MAKTGRSAHTNVNRPGLVQYYVKIQKYCSLVTTRPRGINT